MKMSNTLTYRTWIQHAKAETKLLELLLTRLCVKRKMDGGINVNRFNKT